MVLAKTEIVLTDEFAFSRVLPVIVDTELTATVPVVIVVLAVMFKLLEDTLAAYPFIVTLDETVLLAKPTANVL